MTLSQADVDSLLGPQPADSVESLLDAPLTGEDISLAMQDPSYQPTQDDYLKYEEYAKNKQVDWIDTIAKSVDAAAGMIGGAVSQGAQGAAVNPLNYIEGAAQGTRQLYGLVAQSQDPSSPLFKFKDLVAGTGTPESRYKQFLDARDFANTTARLERGEEGIVIPPELTNPEFVQGVSMILDPTLALPGIGEVFGAGKLATRAVGKGTQLAGRAIAGAARPLERISGAAEKIAAEAIGVTPEALRSTAATAGIAGALGIAPQVATAAAIPAGIRTAREAGEALARAGENLMTQPSRIGPLEAIGAAPGANLRQRMLGVVGQYGGDAALDASLRSIAGGIEGAALGAGLGYLSGGEEGAAAGLGAGGVQGAAGALGGRAFEKLTGTAAKEARAGDLGRFIDAQQDPTTKALFERVRDTHGVDTASALMDVGDLVKGQFGDIDIRYLSDADFVDQYKGRARGVQVEIGDRPTIVINADILGKGKGDSPLYTLGHELFHALEKSQQLSGGATEIKNALVGRWIQEGDVIRKLADGAFSDSDIEARFNEYRDKLAAGNKQRADELAQFDTINKKADYIASELAAEHFAALIAGQKPDAMLKGFTGLSRQLLDAALTQNASRAIANAAASIERTFGVKPTDSVLFPDLKQASPQVNAMLRDLLRARKRLDEKIMLDSEKGGRVLKPEDVSNPLAAKELVDLGLAEQMPDGTVRNLSSDEIRARDDKDLTSLRSITDKLPGARLVDGEISGRFSPEQLSAIEQSQTISSRMKDKIRAVNLAIENGNSLFVTYYAALRRVRNRLTGKESPKYSSGIKVSEREFVPYSFQITKADNPLVRAIDITKVRNELTKLLKKDGSIGGLWANTDGFMADLAKYFTNLDQKEGALRSAEIFGVDKAKFLGDFINSSEKSGGKFIRSFRLDRVGSMAPMDFKAKFSEEAYQLSKQRWMPSEKIGDKSVTNSDEGYRIISGAKHKLYGPDGKLIGIYDTQTQAERKADATQARLQPEVRQQQYPVGNEVRKTAEAGRGDSALGRTQGREEGRQELGAVRQEGDVRFMPDVDRNLVALHNTTEEGIRSALKLGGIPVPSLGITKKDKAFTGFGDITLIADKATVDPQSDPRNRLYNADVYSPRQPRPFQAVKRGAKDALSKRMLALLPKGFQNWNDIAPGERAYDRIVEKGENNVVETTRKLTGSADVQAAFLTQNGVQVPRLMKDPNLRNRVLEKEQLSDPRLAVLSQHSRDLYDFLQTPDGLAVSDVIRDLAYKERGGTVGDLTNEQKQRLNDLLEKSYGARGTPFPFRYADDIVGDLDIVAKNQKEVDRYGIQEWIREQIKPRETEFKNWVDGLVADTFEPDKKLIRGSKKLPYTLENVTDAMTGKVRGQEEGGLTHSLGRARSESAVQFRDLEQARAAESSLMTREELKPLRQERQNQFDRVVEALAPFDKYPNRNAFDRLDNLSEAVGKIAKRPASATSVLASFDYTGISPQVLSDVKTFAISLRNDPTEYFEAKPQRAVGLNEFKAAIVPESTSQDVVDALRSSGLYVEKYTDNANRIATVERVSSDQGLRFMPSDTDYLSAVEKGDTKTAQRMVDEAAKSAGYDTRGLWRSVRRNKSGSELESREQSYVTDDLEAAKRYKHGIKYALQKVYAKLGNTLEIRTKDDLKRLVPEIDISGDDYVFESLDKDSVRKKIWSLGYDSVKFTDMTPDNTMEHTAWLLKDSGTIKSSNPITRDDAGNVIPLSQRFKATSGDIRYMPTTSQREVGRNVDFANPPTEEKAKAALSSAKQPFWRKHESLPEGSPVGVRIDIPAFLNRGTYVQTIHEPATPGNVGDRIGYDTNVRLSGPVRFFVKEGSEESKLGAVAIKEGRAAKHPIATVEGRLIKDRSIPSDIETWIPVGMDPKKHSYFYDKRTDQPVIGGSESFSVGNTVFVKDPVYGNPQDFRYMPQPDSSMPGAYTFTGGYRALPGKTKGSLRLYGPAGSLLGIASSLDEAQRILRRKAKQ